MKVIKVTVNLPTTKDNQAKYHFNDGSVVKVVYSPEFGESQPEGPCSPEQQAAIFAYLEEAIARPGRRERSESDERQTVRQSKA